MRMRGWMRAIWMALVVAAVAGCAPPDPPDEEGRLTVVTTVGMIADVVKSVGGERVRVIGLMGPGVDPHLYKASEGDVRRLYRADVVFYGGLHLEARMSEELEEMGERTRVLAVTDSIPRDALLRTPQFATYDPHVWFDVNLWSMTVGLIASTLADADPAHAAEYRANAERYRGELRQLDAYVMQQALRVPAERRVLITAHDAFSYFGRRYGFEVRGLQGISTAAEAGTADVQELAGFITRRRIPAVFVETSIAPRTIEAVREAVRAQGFDVQIGGSLHSDALGDENGPAGTYPGMVRHNIDTLVRALLREP